jgi:hypothetical protein
MMHMTGRSVKQTPRILTTQIWTTDQVVDAHDPVIRQENTPDLAPVDLTARSTRNSPKKVFSTLDRQNTKRATSASKPPETAVGYNHPPDTLRRLYRPASDQQ